MSGRASDSDEATYQALAAGPGSLRRAVELAARRPVPSERGSPAEQLPVPEPPEPVRAFPRHPSATYRRVYEELSHYVSPPVAHGLLADGMAEVGATPESATSYDVRGVLVEWLPAQLSRLLSSADVEASLEALEAVLVEMHAPRRAPSSAGPGVSTPPP